MITGWDLSGTGLVHMFVGCDLYDKGVDDLDDLDPLQIEI